MNLWELWCRWFGHRVIMSVLTDHFTGERFTTWHCGRCGKWRP